LTSQQRAPAKLNLELRVLGLRPDGSHEVETILQAIDLADRLSITPAAKSTLVTEGGFPVPPGPDNLVLRAAAEIGLTAHFVLNKVIPPGAGLGGGSSDAAAVLRASRHPRPELAAVACRPRGHVPGREQRLDGFALPRDEDRLCRIWSHGVAGSDRG